MNKTIRLFYLFFAVFAGMFISCNSSEPASPTDSSIAFNTSLTYDSLTDINGNKYHTIIIGTQT